MQLVVFEGWPLTRGGNARKQRPCFNALNRECGGVVDEGGLSREGLLYVRQCNLKGYAHTRELHVFVMYNKQLVLKRTGVIKFWGPRGNGDPVSP